MAVNNIYRLGSSAGVRGLRVLESGISVNEEKVIRQDFVGIALDTEAEVWKTSLLGTSRTLLTEAIGGDIQPRYPAVRINHPELGSILYADLTKEPVRFNGSNRAYQKNLDETVYIGEGGSIIDQNPGIKYVLLDGTSLITYDIPA